MKMNEVAVGIDLGTTYSCVAIYKDGKVDIIQDCGGERLTPSYVAFQEEGKVVVGSEAKNEALLNRINTIYDSKRIIGRCYYDEIVQKDKHNWPFSVVERNSLPMYEIYNNCDRTLYSAEQISAEILKHMKTIASQYLRREVKKAVITVPAYFSDSQKSATLRAGEMAGFEVLHLLPEPTAAALAYGFRSDTKHERNIMVFDLGGGTFDVSLVTVKENKFVVKAISGEPHLGGEDFTEKLVAYVARDIKEKFDVDVYEDVSLIQLLRKKCEKAKKRLSREKKTKIVLSLNNGPCVAVDIYRIMFERICSELFEKTKQHLQNTLDAANLSKDQVENIILVGGSTRIPWFREMLTQFFSDSQLRVDISPDEAVACGAAIEAAKLSGKQDEFLKCTEILDVTPLSLGVNVEGGLHSVIIPRNTQIPCEKSVEFATIIDNQECVLIEVQEGERLMSKHNHYLANFIFSNLPKKPKGEAKIDIVFKIDKNGILQVTAIDKSDGHKAEIKIKREQRTILPSEVREVVNDAQQNREEDMKELMAIERVVSIQNTLKQLLISYKELLKDENNKFKNLIMKEADSIKEIMSSAFIIPFDELESLCERAKTVFAYFEKRIKGKFFIFVSQNINCFDSDAGDSQTIGIDLGTTQCTLSVYENKGPRIVAQIPCVVWLSDGEIHVGDEVNPSNDADVLLNAHRLFHPLTTENDSFLKQLTFDYKNGKIKLNHTKDASFIDVETFVSLLLFKMKSIAENYLGQEILKAVISIPCSATILYEEMLRRCASRVGLKVECLLRPTLAAALSLYHSDDYAEKSNLLLFDFGGGTIDISIVSFRKNSIREINSFGDCKGGVDFDSALVEHMLSDTYYGQKMQKYELHRIASNAKNDILRSDHFEAIGEIEATYVERKTLNELSRLIYKQCIECVKKCLEKVKLDVEQISEVILLGGCSQIPKIQAKLGKLFKNVKINKRYIKNNLVAKGMAIKAAIVDEKIMMDVETIFLHKLSASISGKMKSINTEDLSQPFANRRLSFEWNESLPSHVKSFMERDDHEESVLSLYEDIRDEKYLFFKSIWVDITFDIYICTDECGLIEVYASNKHERIKLRNHLKNLVNEKSAKNFIKLFSRNMS
ncbi:heat shock protein Hsp70: cytosolic-like protein [Dinothrombium tinctorium]|uniref:Heat shock protein Hsp70: cytosolic-like protein n=1 Tax=Dinothrombium tinctorium TaxID=1965070 RepID=A0A3S3RS80_9ACAR|nr:heat shock protein Hsp70: cytosolic-like protein [Dinothrombium tinctorium]RWS04796.1 heat shock protein Hsp70: cytosolic-like protein [Dinothrombium tinctorium]RWS04800.1 heat shock protein Hsp70: cytosolic-like protein [Dinothrombium tinctorium]